MSERPPEAQLWDLLRGALGTRTVGLVAELNALLLDLREDGVDGFGGLDVRGELCVQLLVTHQARLTEPIDDFLDFLVLL